MSMDFVKLSQKIHTDTNLIAAGCEAFTMYVKGITFSKDNELDGLIPFEAIPIIGLGVRSTKKTGQVLVDRGLWEAVEGGFRVTPERWQKWQTTKEQAEQVREDWRERQRLSREKKVLKVGDKSKKSPDVTPMSRVTHGGITQQEKEIEKEKEITNQSLSFLDDPEDPFAIAFEAFFQKFKETYPHRPSEQKWPKAKRLLFSEIRSGDSLPETIIENVAIFRRYSDSTKNAGTDFVPAAGNWVEDRGWEDEYPTVLAVLPGGRPEETEEATLRRREMLAR